MSGITLPPELVNLITTALVAGVTWLVVAGVKGLGEAFGKDFSVAAKAIAAVVATGVVSTVFGLVDLGLSAIPAEWVGVVNSVLTVIVAILTAMGIQRQSKM